MQMFGKSMINVQKKNPEKYLAKSLIIEVALPPNDCAVLKVSLRRFAKFFLYCRQFFFAKDALVYGPYRDFIQIDVKSNETRLTYGRVHFSQIKYDCGCTNQCHKS